jgi:beta-mannosidase
MHSPDTKRTALAGQRALLSSTDRLPIDGQWQAARTPPGACESPHELDRLEWLMSSAPTTAAAVMRDTGAWKLGESHDFDNEEWWFRTSFDASAPGAAEETVLCLDGIATVAEVYLNGELLLRSKSMFASHEIDVGTLLAGRNVLAVRCLSLAESLAVKRSPRARWRTRLVSSSNLRFFRTMLLGRAPGFAPAPAAVGPFRPVWLERRHGVALEELVLSTSLEGRDGILEAKVLPRLLGDSVLSGAELELSGPSGTHRAPIDMHASGCFQGRLIVPDVARWWPHTHGEPVLHDVNMRLLATEGTVCLQAGRVGFRELAKGPVAGHDVETDGLDLRINGVDVFARGAVWAPIDLVALSSDEQDLRTALEQVRDAGMNMLRIPGTALYESEVFYDLCDELGLLVWQDFMFANMDYPLGNEEFRKEVECEIGQVLSALAGRPSLAVLCGNSEIEQQVAMLGLNTSLGRGELFSELIPDAIDRSGTDAIYVVSAPCGGKLPFRLDSGIANYYGIGGYRRDLTDVKHAGVRFAAECLAFSNVPDDGAITELLAGKPSALTLQHPCWKAGVPRDNGADWDFEDVRDHYFKAMFELDPGELRGHDPQRYLELSRLVTGEVMAQVFGEWRRTSSCCRGGMVLWLRDLYPGPGWGLLDSSGRPKVAYHYLRRALSPVAIWMTDEGLGGLKVHIANERPDPLHGHLRLALYSDFEHCVHEVSQQVSLAPNETLEYDAESVLGHFVDISWAYRFGPPAQNLIVAALSRDGAGAQASKRISHDVHFPAGYPLEREPAERIGLLARSTTQPDGSVSLALVSTRLTWGVRVDLPGYQPQDDAFSLEPGVERVIQLTPILPLSGPVDGSVGAANMNGVVAISTDDSAM